MWGLGASMGLEAVLAASTYAYDCLRIAGACYLAYIGIRMLRGLGRRPGRSAIRLAPPSRVIAPGHWFTCGFFTNILNPKVGVFYISFLPQFIPQGVNVLRFSVLLASIHALEGALWFTVLVTATAHFSKLIQRPAVSAAIDGLTGSLFIAFGIKLALENRR